MEDENDIGDAVRFQEEPAFLPVLLRPRRLNAAGQRPGSARDIQPVVARDPKTVEQEVVRLLFEPAV
ncbi:MAG: hypothetical protein LC772_01155 [Chloroflexi bacterium]|nr:hypothetical protein [Chloroflexota bacterium]